MAHFFMKIVVDKTDFGGFRQHRASNEIIVGFFVFAPVFLYYFVTQFESANGFIKECAIVG
jgi:hypothetical protein